MKVLGHKNINNTLVYTQLMDFGGDEYTVRVAHTIEEDKQLIEAGFVLSRKGMASKSTENANKPLKKCWEARFKTWFKFSEFLKSADFDYGLKSLASLITSCD